MLALLTTATAGDVTSFDPFSLIANGLIGAAFLLLFVTGRVHPNSTVARLEAELKAAKDTIEAKDGQLSTLNAAMVDKVIPVAAQSLLVLQQLASRPPGGS